MNATASTSTRRDEILDIAAVGFARSGFDGCSVREIAREAQILSGSLYHHFASKDEMVVEIIAHYWERLFGAYEQVLDVEASPDDTLTALVMASLAVAAECPNEVRILHQDWHYLSAVLPDLDENMGRIERTFTAIVEAGVAEGILRRDIDPRIAYRTIMGAISWVTRWYNPGGPLSMPEIGATQAMLWVDGLRIHGVAA